MSKKNVLSCASATGFIPKVLAAVFVGLASLAFARDAAAVACRSEASSGVDWSNCKKRMLMLNGSTLDGANLSSTDLSMTDLGNSSLNGAALTKATLVRASLVGAQAQGANFEKVEGYRSNLSEISATGASFISSELQRANLSEADLRNANFTKAELSRAIFYKARLDNARFSMTNLSRAIFHEAQITGAVDFAHAFLFLTRIEGVDLSSATGLTQEQVSLACGNDATKLPPGLQRPQEWPCDDD